MTRVRGRGKEVRKFVTANIEQHPNDIAKVTADKFGITRQAVGRHLKNMVSEGGLMCDGTTRARTYKLRPLQTLDREVPIDASLSESDAWLTIILPALESSLPENVVDLWHYGFTEIFNNAIDHAEGRIAQIHFERTAVSTTLLLHDDGVGIFQKIQGALGLADERHAVLELFKGKFTTDPDNHTGEGIFFTSRMFDEFIIWSGDTFFSHDEPTNQDWAHRSTKPAEKGTTVLLSLSNHTSKTMTRVFNRFRSEGEEYGFTKTIVPVKMTEYGDDKLVSRSQAKRLMARFDRFKTVVLDFKGVSSIGRSFADEVFRVYINQHPEIMITSMNENSAVKRMIAYVTALNDEPK
nr:MAG: DUF4325 domain-containing protein [Pseudomonadota bacterium]